MTFIDTVSEGDASGRLAEQYDATRAAYGWAAGLDEVDVAVMDFAEKVVDDAASVTQADVDRLRGLGLCEFAGLEPELRDSLVVGRSISDV